MVPGFDKIHLSTKDFTIKDISKLGQNRNIHQGKTEQDIPIITIDTGTTTENIRANNLYFNHDLFNVSINKVGAQVIYNPSKILHPYELLTDTNELKRVGNIITSEMKKNGILLNIDHASVTRMDLAKQTKTQRSIYSYRTAFDFMKGKRLSKVGFDGGYRWNNKTHEIQIYDKGLESNLPFKNFTRCEAKFKKTRYIQTKTGINKYADFFHLDTRYINDTYNNYLTQTIFSGTSQQIVIDFNTEVEKLIALKKAGRNAVLSYLAVASINDLIAKFGSIEVLFDMMKEAGFTKGAISKQREQIKNLMSFTSGSISTTNVKLLIEELKHTFAA